MKNVHQFKIRYHKKLLIADLKSIKENWSAHFNTDYYQGNWSGVTLRQAKNCEHVLGTHGTVYEDTELLKSLSYIPQILDEFKCEKTSVRLLKLSKDSKIETHRDVDLDFWKGDVRLHIPIVSNPEVKFTIDGEEVHMPVGTCWYANFSTPHSVVNNGTTDRVHLIIDCKVNDWLRNLFIQEGILDSTESAPKAEDSMSIDEKKKMIAALKEMGTETAIILAKNLEQEYNIYE